MEYQVIHKETNKLLTITHEDINDMDYDDTGRIVVYGVTGEVYYLLADRDMIREEI
ncbi:hypothetical protein [Paenibacillus eucommiae]|uniref:Uncharacterized protein n=1 Tax=Paenibacillus eucommiae TaxID=1355755 RepID=A0ABS4J5W4_9BACL|nr:hypothetical protein [Paenibacillus eucommiae]MBP1995213.1 hypothetical protein [Paenibacillus eucommiae]